MNNNIRLVQKPEAEASYIPASAPPGRSQQGTSFGEERDRYRQSIRSTLTPILQRARIGVVDLIPNRVPLHWSLAYHGWVYSQATRAC